jgi:hypothetical protein
MNEEFDHKAFGDLINKDPLNTTRDVHGDTKQSESRASDWKETLQARSTVCVTYV